jgi:membrane protein required for colicin V production
MPTLTALDILVLLLVGGGAVLGTIRGFVTEVISLFAWVAAIFALKMLHGPAADMLTGVVGTAAGAAVLAFALVFGAVFIAGKLVAASLGGRVKRSVLGPVDRLLGLGFGALKGLIIATLLFLAANLALDTISGADAERPGWMQQSRSYTLLHASGRAVVDFVQARRERREEGNAVENVTENRSSI